MLRASCLDRGRRGAFLGARASRSLAAAALVAAAGCKGVGASGASEGDPSPAFRLEGSRIIGCCCAAPCPCRINKKPMQCHGCDHTDAVHVDRGFIGDTRMDGVTWVTVGRGFGEDPDGNWLVVYLDEKATEAQEAALRGMLERDLAAWGSRKAQHLAGAFKGLRRVPVSYAVTADRREYAAGIPGILELRTRAHVNPGHSNPVVSTGIMDAFGDRFTHADCLSHKYEDDGLGYQWDLTGRQANFADFVLDPGRVAQGAIGWGCWTAHSEYDDKEPYQEQLIGKER